MLRNRLKTRLAVRFAIFTWVFAALFGQVSLENITTWRQDALAEQSRQQQLANYSHLSPRTVMINQQMLRIAVPGRFGQFPLEQTLASQESDSSRAPASQRASGEKIDANIDSNFKIKFER